MNKLLNVVRLVSVVGAAVLSLSVGASRASADDARMNVSGQACGAGVALVSPASNLRGTAAVSGHELAVLNVDGNEVRGLASASGYSLRARGAVNSDIGRGNVQHCAF